MSVAPRFWSDSMLAPASVMPRIVGELRHGFFVAGLPVAGSFSWRKSPSWYFAHAASVSAKNVVPP